MERQLGSHKLIFDTESIQSNIDGCDVTLTQTELAWRTNGLYYYFSFDLQVDRITDFCLCRKDTRQC